MAKRFQFGFVQQGRAEDILNCKPRFNNSMSGEYVELTQLDKDFSLVRNRSFYRFLQDLRSSNGSGSTCRVTGAEKEKLMIRHGGAVFKNWRLVGWLSDEETQAVNWIVGESNATIICEKGNGTYTYQTKKRQCGFSPG